MAVIGCSFVFYIIILFIYLLPKTSFPIFYTLLLCNSYKDIIFVPLNNQNIYKFEEINSLYIISRCVLTN